MIDIGLISFFYTWAFHFPSITLVKVAVSFPVHAFGSFVKYQMDVIMCTYICHLFCSNFTQYECPLLPCFHEWGFILWLWFLIFLPWSKDSVLGNHMSFRIRALQVPIFVWQHRTEYVHPLPMVPGPCSDYLRPACTMFHAEFMDARVQPLDLISTSLMENVPIPMLPSNINPHCHLSHLVIL